jgi:acetylornithine deacetylase/succinyl-diaminopimelate desuccinylase-like protein
VAAGRRRLGAFLSDIEADLLAVLTVLDGLPAPRGAERDAAFALRQWCSRRWPDATWSVLEHGVRGGSLIGTRGGGPLLCSHLDTSLDGASHDRWVTGRHEPVGAVRIDGGHIDGFGLGVARAPAAAAIAAFAGGDGGSLLISGSGTHRAGGEPTGLAAYLARHDRPPAAIVAKSGPPGVLWEEPGACYVSVQLRGRSGVVLAPESATPAGGVAARAGVVLEALTAWCADYVASRPPVGQVGAAAGIGAVRSGWTDKPDLLPALLEVGLYVVTVPGEDVPALTAQIRERVGRAVAGSPLRDCLLDVHTEQVHPAAATSADAPIVRAACRLWAGEFGAPPQPVTGWTGSTDGVVLRGHGVDTVRLGPTGVQAPDDPRRDRFEIATLAGFARLYRRLLAN